MGKAPTARDADRYEHTYSFCDVLILGGGIAGLQAALVAGASGARVMLLEQSAHWGGRAPVDGDVIEGDPADVWINSAVQTLAALENVTMQSAHDGRGGL